MCLLEEEDSQDNADHKKSSADEVGKEVGEALKQRSDGKHIGPRVMRVRESTADAWSENRSNAPNEGHDCECARY